MRKEGRRNAIYSGRSTEACHKPNPDFDPVWEVWEDLKKPAVAMCFFVIFNFNMFLTASEVPNPKTTPDPDPNLDPNGRL